MKTLSLIIVCLAVWSGSFSQRTLIYAVHTGNWSDDSTWSQKRQPSNDDSIVIPPGVKVKLTTSKSLTNVVINIFGILTIDEAGMSANSNDLDITTSSNKTSLVIVSLANSAARIERGLDHDGGGRIRIKVNNIGNFITKYSTQTKTLTGLAIAYNNFNTSFFRDPGGSLVVVLLEFSISNTDKSVMLKWKSQQENNYEMYFVERSRDALVWQKIAEVKAVANSTVPQQYSYTDIAPLSGINYYRLRLVNYDGKFGFTPVKAARLNSSTNSVSIYPNPATSIATIFINDEEAKNLNVRVYNRTGQLAGTQKSEAASNIIMIDVSRLASGDYSVEVSGDNGYRKILRLIVGRK